ncbi:MAG: hypothetical protein DHS20C11_06270 [Lysobacteraceae bacterium]|nr:MAG: hypothetical protein DHS20C11_06270 [Xanthomonadaceae bacterium]
MPTPYYQFHTVPFSFDVVWAHLTSFPGALGYVVSRVSDEQIELTRFRWAKDKVLIQAEPGENQGDTKVVVACFESKLRHGPFRREPNLELTEFGFAVSNHLSGLR